MGHEMGHIKSRHVTYQTIGRFLNEGLEGFVNPAFSPLKVAIDAWSRGAKKTADRTGYLVTENPVDSIKALIMLPLGSRKLLSEFNLEKYLLKNDYMIFITAQSIGIIGWIIFNKNFRQVNL